MLKKIAYLFLASQYTLLIPYTSSLHLYGRGAFCIFFCIALILKKVKFEKKEFNVLLFLTVPFSFLMLLQGIITQEVMPLKKMLSFVAASLSAVAIYKILGLKRIFNFFLFFVLINCIVSLIWLSAGSIYIEPVSGTIYTVYLTLQQAIYPIHQETGDFSIVRLAGFTGNPNTLGELAAFCFIYGNFVELSGTKKKAMNIVIVLAIIITQSRGALLFVISYCLFVMVQSRRLSLWKKIITFILLVVALTGTIQWSQYRDNSTDVSSGRMDMASMSYDGFENSSNIYQIIGVPYNIHDFLWNKTHQIKITIDNSYLLNLISLGYFGTLINYFFLLYVLIYVLINTSNRKYKYKILAFYISLFIYGGVESILLNSDQLILYEVLLYSMVSYRREIE